MAEGILKSIDSSLEVFSAGISPANGVNRRAIQVMREIGIDISLGFTKNFESFINENFDYVLIVCKNARMNIPEFEGEVKNYAYIGFEDPWEAQGSNDDVMMVFRKVRDKMKRELFQFYLDNVKK